jgi:hypothetical protein
MFQGNANTSHFSQGQMFEVLTQVLKNKNRRILAQEVCTGVLPGIGPCIDRFVHAACPVYKTKTIQSQSLQKNSFLFEKVLPRCTAGKVSR